MERFKKGDIIIATRHHSNGDKSFQGTGIRFFRTCCCSMHYEWISPGISGSPGKMSLEDFKAYCFVKKGECGIVAGILKYCKECHPYCFPSCTKHKEESKCHPFKEGDWLVEAKGTGLIKILHICEAHIVYRRPGKCWDNDEMIKPLDALKDGAYIIADKKLVKAAQG